MNWDALGAIGEILGAVAVLITLIYLAIQIRQNTAAVATATYDSLISGYNDMNIAIATDPNLARVVNDGMYSPDSLNDNERIRFSFLMRAVANQTIKLFRLSEAGGLSREEWQTYGREFAQILRTPGGQIFRSEHLNFADLYEALDKLEDVDVTTFRLGDSGALNQSEGPDSPA